MRLKLKMYNTCIKPIIKVKILCNGKTIDTYALVDTGSSKPVWVGSETTLKSVSKEHISDNGALSGFGLQQQKNCIIESIDICIRDEKYGINFRDLHVTCANLNTGGLFSLVLPYTMFNKFIFEFHPARENYEFGEFVIDTPDNRINYHLIDNNGMITDVFADLDSEYTEQEINAFNINKKLQEAGLWRPK